MIFKKTKNIFICLIAKKNLLVRKKVFFSPIQLLLLLLALVAHVSAQNQNIVREFESKISDFGLFFDGNGVPSAQRLSHPNRTDGRYDYAFGNRITPHGDCIAQYGDYVYLTWYRGGKTDRHVMLTRVNMVTKSEVTIEFPHRHTGFQNRWWVGESHNTIAVGICPIDETVHLLYDMHAYSRTRPENGSLSNDYFRYSVSKKNVATLPDEDFTLDKFFPKRLYLKQGENYEGLTYPDFFVNTNNELLVKMRVGGNNNGKFQMAKYDGTSWSNWVDYNILNARNRPEINYNWGLYGDFQYLHGKFQIGYVIRKNDNNDRYLYNNGFFYSYSNAPDGSNDWYNYKGESVSSPIIDPYEVFISEPGNKVTGNAPNSVVISSGPIWTVTERGDIHFMINNVRGANNQRVNVHTYKKAGDSVFTTSTNFPGGSEFLSVGNDIYLIGLNNGRPFIRKAEGGTNNWSLLYQVTSGRSFRHGNVLAKDGKIYYYLMENRSGNAQPIYLQVYDLDLEPDSSLSLSITSPVNGSVFEPDEAIIVNANIEGDIETVKHVEFYANDSLIAKVDTFPYTATFIPNIHGIYSIRAKALDSIGQNIYSQSIHLKPNLPQLEISVNNEGGNVIVNPEKEFYNIGEEIVISVEAKTGFRFLNWTGDVLSEENPLTLKMDSTIQLTANFENTTSLNEFSNSLLRIFPNPSQGVFNIETDGRSSYSIYNISGVCISKGDFNSNFVLDIKKHGNGLYVLMVRTSSGTYIEKIVVNGL